MSFKNIPLEELQLNPMEMIGVEWWLITAGSETGGYNTMTASWGHLGAVWERPGGKAHKGLPTAVVYLRPSRYTKEFMDRESLFTLSVLPDGYKKQLAYLGAHSGRDGDKIAAVGLTPAFSDETTYFEQAKLVFICRKLYHSPLLEEGFVDRGIVENNFPNGDLHEMYVGEIIKVLVREES